MHQLRVLDPRRPRRQPQRRRRVGGAPGEPGGQRDVLVHPQPQRRPAPAAGLAEGGQRPRRQVLLGRTRQAGQTTSSAPSPPPGSTSRISSSASEIDCITLTSSCLPSDSRTGPTNSPRLTFAGASVRRTSPLEHPASSRNCCGERRSARTSDASPSAERLLDGLALRPPTAASPPASCAGGRSRRPPAPVAPARARGRARIRRRRPAAPGAPGATAPSPRSVPGRRRCGDRPHHADLGGELGEHRRQAVGAGARAAASRSPTSRWAITTHSPADGSSCSERRTKPAAIPYGRLATTLFGGGSRVARSSRIASAHRSDTFVCPARASPSASAAARRPRPRAGGRRARPGTR